MCPFPSSIRTPPHRFPPLDRVADGASSPTFFFVNWKKVSTMGCAPLGRFSTVGWKNLPRASAPKKNFHPEIRPSVTIVKNFLMDLVRRYLLLLRLIYFEHRGLLVCSGYRIAIFITQPIRYDISNNLTLGNPQ